MTIATGRRLPPVHWLQAFDGAARHMSFTEAARELGVTQPAVSQRIRLLEDHLGQALFVRHARSLELTDAGRAFAPVVQESFERLSAGTETVLGPSGDAPLTLRATPTFAATWLADRLQGFIHRHPRVTLRLTTAIWPSDFGTGDADLEIRQGRGDWAGVVSHRLTRERLLPVCADSVAARLRSPADLANELLLHAAGFKTGWADWLGAAGEARVARRARALLCDTAIVVKALARSGTGVGLIHSSFAAIALERGELVAPFDLAVDTDEAFYLVMPSRRRARLEAGLFRDWILGECAAAPD